EQARRLVAPALASAPEFSGSGGGVSESPGKVPAHSALTSSTAAAGLPRNPFPGSPAAGQDTFSGETGAVRARGEHQGRVRCLGRGTGAPAPFSRPHGRDRVVRRYL